MKYLCTIAILLTFFTSNFANQNYSTGDALYVWAISGLNMRIEADAAAQKLLNIPYSEQVIVIDSSPFIHPFSYCIIEGKNLNNEEIRWVADGYWVKVEYKGKTGYVFDAYLGRYPTPSIEEPRKDVYTYFHIEFIKEYGKLYWEGLAEEYKTSTLNFDDYNRDPDKGHSSTRRLSFKNGAYCENWSVSFGGGTKIFLKDATLTEAYLLFNILTNYEKKRTFDNDNKSYIEFEAIKKDELRFGTDSNTEFMIKKVEGGVLITMEGGC